MEKQEILKLTVPKLREAVLENVENVAGVHGMDKETLIDILFDQFGIEREVRKKKVDTSELKAKIKELQAKKAEVPKEEKVQRDILRKKIRTLKRATRI